MNQHKTGTLVHGSAHQEFCHDPRHGEPCPLPCAACEAECKPEPNEVAYRLEGHEITWDRIRSVLCGAFEGGSNYWYLITQFVEPEVGHIPWPGETECFRHIDYPVRKGGAVIVESKHYDYDGEIKPVNRETLLAGLKIMISKYFRHFANIVETTDDATTSDVLLQCTVFGDVVYG